MSEAVEITSPCAERLCAENVEEGRRRALGEPQGFRVKQGRRSPTKERRNQLRANEVIREPA